MNLLHMASEIAHNYKIRNPDVPQTLNPEMVLYACLLHMRNNNNDTYPVQCDIREKYGEEHEIAASVCGQSLKGQIESELNSLLIRNNISI